MTLKPSADRSYGRQRIRSRPAFKLSIAAKLRAPAINLPGQEIGGLSKIRQAQRFMIERTKGGDPVHQGQPHGMAHLR
jgi:hypothetical protein